MASLRIEVSDWSMEQAVYRHARNAFPGIRCSNREDLSGSRARVCPDIDVCVGDIHADLGAPALFPVGGEMLQEPSLGRWAANLGLGDLVQPGHLRPVIDIENISAGLAAFTLLEQPKGSMMPWINYPGQSYRLGGGACLYGTRIQYLNRAVSSVREAGCRDVLFWQDTKLSYGQWDKLMSLIG